MPIPFAPNRAFYEPSTRAQDIILRQGDDAARAAQRSGQIWGGAIQNLGGIASQVVQDRAEQKAMSRRDQAVAEVWQRSNGNPDIKDLVAIYGPKEGTVLAKNLAEFNAAKANPREDAISRFPAVAGIMSKLGEPLQEAFWNSEVVPVGQAAGILSEPIPWKPGIEKELLKGFMPAEPGPTKLNKNERLIGANNEILVDAVEDGPKAGTFEAFLVSKAGLNPTPEQQIAARKEWEMANDSPPDPLAQELGRLRLSEAQEKAQTRAEAERAFESVPVERRTAIDRVTNSMTKAKADSWKKTLANAAMSGDEDELKSQIKQAALESEFADTRKQIAGRDDMVGLLRDAELILKDMKARGIPTNFFSGTAEDLLRKVGTTSNPEYAALGNRLAETLINYRKAATGAQFSEKESSAYEKMFPNYKNTLPVNQALIEGLIGAATTNSRSYWKRKLGEKNADWILGATRADARSLPDGSKPGPGATGAGVGDLRPPPGDAGIITTPDGKRWKKVGGRMVEQP